MLDFCRRTGLGSSIGIIEFGYIRCLLGFWRNGLVPPGAIVRLIFGSDRVLGGLPPTKAALDLYLDVLDGTGLPWSVGVMGGNPLDNGFARYALERGGHIRIGLEDFAAPGPTNAELVTAAAALVREVGRPLATPSSAAKQLGLPGGR
jgi:3-keto-5-aminohexanoate cleavage enzyme